MRKIIERSLVRVWRKVPVQISVAASTLMLIACGPNFQPTHLMAVNANSIDPVLDGEAAGPASSFTTGATNSSPISGDVGTTFCSQLSFSGVTWDQTLNLNARRAFAIALSISGGFEGGDGWANLTNNFDGTGMSAGLLNQTLGTGSLQPLLSTMQSKHTTEFKGAMTSAHYTSVSGMLSSWQKSTSWKPSEVIQLSSLSEPGVLSSASEVRPLNAQSNVQLNAQSNVQLNAQSNVQLNAQSQNTVSLNSELASSPSEPVVFTPLDIGFQIASTATNLSVSWATANLYTSSGAFIATWKTDMQKLLRLPNYVTIQINAALKYHTLAQKYMARVGYNDLRTYLLMFDIVTQNGSISDARFTQWEQQVASQKITGEAARLKALVEIRLLDTLAQWRADVRSRKYALIDGTGTVHGSSLNLPKKYCYALSDGAK